MRELSLDGVSIELVRKRIKNIYLRVLSPSGQIRISVPLRVSDMAVREFLLSKLAWIHDRRQHVCAAVPQYTRTFADGEEILFWGRPRRIRFFPVGGKRRIFLRGEFVDLHVLPSDKTELRGQLVEKLQRRELEREIPPLLALWCPVVGVPVPEFFIRRMSTRWGSCSPAAKRIRFALHLAEKPPHFLEYVVVHELVHLLEQGHNKRFAAWMDRFLPHWRAVHRDMHGSA